MRTFVIAEAGISHDGDIERAFALIEHAKQAGADACKFQTFNAAKLSERRKDPSLYAKLKPYEMPLTWLPQLREKCEDADMEFMTTCFDERTLEIVSAFVKRFKIAASESRDTAFIEAHLKYGKELIISTNGGFNPYPAKYLHCVSRYPTQLREARLRDIYNNGCDGFSDHTKHVLTGAYAVACGARIVEVHFRDWYTDKDNPDRGVSHDPADLLRYIHFIREAEVACFYGVDEEETKKLEPPQSSPRTSHPPGSGATDHLGDPLAGVF